MGSVRLSCWLHVKPSLPTSSSLLFFLQHQWGRVLVNLSPVQLLQGDLTNQQGQQGFTCNCWRPMHLKRRKTTSYSIGEVTSECLPIFRQIRLVADHCKCPADKVHCCRRVIATCACLLQLKWVKRMEKNPRFAAAK